MGEWEGRSAADLANLWGAPAVHLFSEIGSTNDAARRLAADGAETGTLVLADRQTAGRGRAGRVWDTPARLGIALSLVLRPLPGTELGALPLIVGLEVAESIEPLISPAPARLKWPNDILVNGRKLAGILCEAAWEGGEPRCVVVGVGINIAHRADDLPPGLRETATSIRMESGCEPRPAALVDELVPRLIARLRQPLVLSAADRTALTARDALQGRDVEVTEPETGALRTRGTALGLSADGGLMVRETDGSVHTVRSGTVRALAGGVGR